MKRLLAIAATVGTLALATVAMSTERTAKFAIDSMTCVSCPWIVKKSMEGVPGVSRVQVSYAKKMATVTFDDARTTVDAIAQASANTGFPAKPVQQGRMR